MKNQGKLSIVIPCHNKVKYVANTMQSIYNQTWDNIEVILVNDGAVDGTREILGLWAEKFRSERGYKVIIIDQKNQGINSAVQAGMKQITGEYFCSIDCDDELDPSYACVLGGYLDTHPEVDVVCCHLGLIADTIDDRTCTIPYLPDVLPSQSHFLYHYLFLRSYIVSWIYVARTAYVHRCKIVERFVLQPSSCQEPCIVVPLLAHGGEIQHIPQPLYFHNQCGRVDILKDHLDRFPGYNNNYLEARRMVINRLDFPDNERPYLQQMERLSAVKVQYCWSKDFVQNSSFWERQAEIAADATNRLLYPRTTHTAASVLAVGFPVFFGNTEYLLFHRDATL